MLLGPISIGEKLKSITSDVLNGSKKFKQDIDYRKRSKHRAVHLEGAENRGNFSGTDQPDDDVKLPMLNFAGAANFTVNLNLN